MRGGWYRSRMESWHDLELLIQSRHPLVIVETWEEERLEAALREVAGRLAMPMHVWTLTGGLRRPEADHHVYDSKEPLKALANLPTLGGDGVWLFKDLHHYLHEPEVGRTLRDLGQLEPGQRRTVVLVAPSVDPPAHLQKLAVRYRLALPGEIELRRLVHRVVEDLGRRVPVRVQLADADYRRLIEGMKGLTLHEAERALTKAILDDRALTDADVLMVQEAKRELLRDEGVVEYLAPQADGVALGGLGRFKSWLEKRQRAFTPEARSFGLPAPKGVVLLGVQGCGKTLAARTVAESWQLPLLKLEPGRLFGKFIGESEQNLERALQLAEHMAPCVLLIDEIEKGFAGASGSEADGGVSRRILGRILGWLQDRTAPVFVVATCNAVDDLPPEMLRKGRFDEIFFVDLPDAAERKAILALHLERRGRESGAFDLDALVEAAEGFSGAELEQAVVAGLYSAFAAGTDIDTPTLLDELRGTRPLSITRGEDVAALRAWARERAVPAR